MIIYYHKFLNKDIYHDLKRIVLSKQNSNLLSPSVTLASQSSLLGINAL